MEEGCRRGEDGKRVEERSGVCVPGVTGTRKFLISFHCDTPRKLLLLSSPGVYGELLQHRAVRRGVNAPLKPKSHDKSFPVLPRLGNV